MSSLGAVLWLEWRLVRRDLAVLCAVSTLLPLLIGRLSAPGVVVGTLAYVLLPLTGSLLGSTLAAEDSGLSFLRARALSWRAVIGLRLGFRCACALLVGGAALASAALFSQDGPALRDWAGQGASGPIAAALLLVGFTAAGALAGAFSRQALGAAFGGWALFLVGASAAALFVHRLVDPWLVPGGETASFPFVARLAFWPTALAVLGAWRALTARTSTEPPRLLPALLRAGLVVAALVLLVGGPQWGRAAWEVHRLRSATAVGPAVTSDPASPAEGNRARDAWLRSAGLIGAQGDLDRAALRRLSEAASALSSLRRGASAAPLSELDASATLAVLRPVEAELGRIESALIKPENQSDALRMGTSQLMLSDSEGLGLHALLLLRERGLREEGRADEAARTFAATWRLNRTRLEHGDWPYWQAFDRQALRWHLQAVRDGATPPPGFGAELSGLELEDTALRGLKKRARWLLEGRLGEAVLAPAEVAQRAQQERRRLAWFEARHRVCDLAESASARRAGLAGAETLADLVRTRLEAELTLAVLAKRDGRSVPGESSCAGARWTERRRPGEAWAIELDGGPLVLAHVEGAERR